jgi:hypothetical protein
MLLPTLLLVIHGHVVCAWASPYQLLVGVTDRPRKKVAGALKREGGVIVYCILELFGKVDLFNDSQSLCSA